MNDPTIFCDTREHTSITRRLKRQGIKVVERKLNIGDFQILKEIVIERKTKNDALSSVYDGRLFNQAKEMLDAYEHPMIIIEGKKPLTLTPTKHRNKKKTIRAQMTLRTALAYLAWKWQIPMLFTINESDTASMLAIIAKQAIKKGHDEYVVHRPKKPQSAEELQRYIVSGVPGVGGITSDALLKKFKTVERVFTANEKDLREVIGKKAGNMRGVITKKYVVKKKGDTKH